MNTNIKWNQYPETKPGEDGWYICTVQYDEGNKNKRYTMMLYYYTDTDKFKDNCRQDVFNVYQVYSITGERLYTTKICDRTEGVVAWAEPPEPFDPDKKAVSKTRPKPGIVNKYRTL